MKINHYFDSDFALKIAAITIISFTLFMSASALSSAGDKHVHKINDVTHIEEFNDMTDTERVDGVYKLSQSGLTDETKRDIMEEKNVVINGESKIEGGTVALTTNNGAYIVDTEISHPNTLKEIIMMLESIILALLVIPIIFTIDEKGYENLFIANLYYCGLLFLLLMLFLK